MSSTAPNIPEKICLPAFAGIGIELEYAIVASDNLDILPIADRLLAEAAGSNATDVLRGCYGWSNELVLHVVEIKNVQPASTLSGIAADFKNEIEAIEKCLQPHHARLLPGGMHPWMHPASQTRLWPHENAALYQHFDQIFDCARHGWSNLQSMHINLPFADDEEFCRLHAAIRLVLPIIPALAASSPFADGVDTGIADYRLAVYADNAAVLPFITGEVIPSTVCSQTEYHETILAPMYRAIAPLDPDGVLQYEWLNSRGAIARFERSAIEIRVTDTQECPYADIAIAGAVTAVVRMLYEERFSGLNAQQVFSTQDLVTIFKDCVHAAEQACIEGPAGAAYLALLGYPGQTCTAQQLWRYLAEVLTPVTGLGRKESAAFDHILTKGTLATRIRAAVGSAPAPAGLRSTYGLLADCLRTGELFDLK